MTGSNEITVRVLGPGDARVFEQVADDVFDHAVRTDQAAAFLASPAHLIAVALSGCLVVGMATGVICLHPDKDPQLWINEVGTGEAWRRRGIATRTTRALMAEAARRGCTEAWLATEHENVPARALYRSLKGTETDGVVVYAWTQSGIGC